MRAKVPGKGWSTFGFTTGIVASVAANVAHSFVPPAKASPSWHPAPGAIVFGAFWPIALLVAIEVIARVEWPSGKGWKVVRHGGLVTVAAIAALISYRHMSGLLATYGEDTLSAAIGPLAVDGLMAVCTAALLATSRHGAAEALPQPAPAPTPAAVGLEPPLPPEPPVATRGPEGGNGLAELEPVEPAEAEPPDPSVANMPLANGQVAKPAEVVAVVRSGDGNSVAEPDLALPQAATDHGNRLSSPDRTAQARQAYRDSVASGQPLTGRELGERFGMSGRWGRLQAREATKEP